MCMYCVLSPYHPGRCKTTSSKLPFPSRQAKLSALRSLKEDQKTGMGMGMGMGMVIVNTKRHDGECDYTFGRNGSLHHCRFRFWFRLDFRKRRQWIPHLQRFEYGLLAGSNQKILTQPTHIKPYSHLIILKRT